MGCSDPCHTLHHRHMYDWSFEEVADVSWDFEMNMSDASNDNVVGDPCFHRYAKNINVHYPDRYITIEKGCIARCAGCTFKPTVAICK
eukprot:CAMPEP_0201621658 /NCGR_PEP_ID=MMETSP0492-20130828/47001_1 /ASSEMBLY_ACC=CAM_ASM_000837 /TAXON_ID=420259 /ORGANISM="Thalassiosira gravida, Strain GMp14c1" /LENGTH=87 /DNA_ID=CAMNT_0048091215 /DNA_START=229 /DNA_END=492 /DNA_ORIENTATION=+